MHEVAHRARGERDRKSAERYYRKRRMRERSWSQSQARVLSRSQRQTRKKRIPVSPLRPDEQEEQLDIDWYGHTPWEALPTRIRNFRRRIHHPSFKLTQRDLNKHWDMEVEGNGEWFEAEGEGETDEEEVGAWEWAVRYLPYPDYPILPYPNYLGGGPILTMEGRMRDPTMNI